MKDKNTQWRPVIGYEGVYEVSENGDVRNVKKEKVLKPQKHRGGYRQIILWRQNKFKALYMHRLVAMSFIENPLCKKQVNHIDGDKSNNRINNLEWVTASENEKHAYNIGLKELCKQKISERCSKEVLDLYSGIFYKSLVSACKATNSKYSIAKRAARLKSQTQRFKYI